MRLKEFIIALNHTFSKKKGMGVVKIHKRFDYYIMSFNSWLAQEEKKTLKSFPQFFHQVY